MGGHSGGGEVSHGGVPSVPTSFEVWRGRSEGQLRKRTKNRPADDTPTRANRRTPKSRVIILGGYVRRETKKVRLIKQSIKFD